MSDLTRLFAEVAAAPPPPAELGPAVRRATRTYPPRAWLLAVAVAVLVAVTVLAVNRGVGGTARRTALDTRPSPSPSAAPAVVPTAAVTAPPAPAAPVPAATATSAGPAPATSPSPAPTVRPARRPTPAPTPAPSGRPSPPPRTGYAAKGAAVTFTTSVVSANAHVVRFTVTVRDDDGYLLSGMLDFGDGTSIDLGQGDTTCGRQGGYEPEPSTSTKAYDHTYSASGRVSASARATTGSSCRPTPQETVYAYGEVNVP